MVDSFLITLNNQKRYRQPSEPIKTDVITCRWHEAREKARLRVNHDWLIGYGFTSDWMRCSVVMQNQWLSWLCLYVSLFYQLLMRDDDFCVERRVCVDMSKIRATKKLSRGFEPHSINLVQGMQLTCMRLRSWKRAIFGNISSRKNKKKSIVY